MNRNIFDAELQLTQGSLVTVVMEAMACICTEKITEEENDIATVMLRFTGVIFPARAHAHPIKTWELIGLKGTLRSRSGKLQNYWMHDNRIPQAKAPQSSKTAEGPQENQARSI